MSVISSLAELFRSGAVPSIEGTFAAGKGRTRALENLARRLGEGVTAPQDLLSEAVGRVQIAGQRGRSIQAGEDVATVDLPVDPTLPIGSNFRYRVRVKVGVANPRDPIAQQTIDTVIPVDSENKLSRQEILDIVRPAIDMLRGNDRYEAIQNVLRGFETGQAEVKEITIVSAYRGPLA